MKIIAMRFIFVVVFLCLMGSGMAFAENGAPDWESYSKGLFLKNRALKTYSPEKRKEIFESAIAQFKDAEQSGNSLEQVYYQISQCYFFMGNSEKSREFAEKAIAVRRDYFPPYNRIFSLDLAEKKYESAGKILEQYVKIQPKDPYPIYRLALLYENNLGKSDKAMEMVDRLILLSQNKIVPRVLMGKTWFLKGMLALKKEDYSTSTYSLKKAHELNGSDLNIVFMLTKANMLWYKLDDAEKYAKVFLKSYPNNIAVNLILGRVYYLRGSKNALETLFRASKAKNFDGITALALYYELIGNDEKALQLLNVLSRYKNPPISLSIALARIDEKRGELQKSRERFVSAGTTAFRTGLYNIAERLFYRALAPGRKNNRTIYYYLARTHEENKKYAMAISYYKRFYRISNEKSILTHIGYLYGVRGEYKKAHAYFKRAMKVSPKEPLPHFFNGLINIWNKRYKAALVSLDRAIELKDDEEGYYFYQAVAYEKLHKKNRTIASLKKALKHNPRSARANNYLGYVYLEMGINYDEAYKLISRALEYDSQNGAYLDSMGWFYFKKGQYEESLNYLLPAAERLEQTDSQDPVVFDHIGDVYLKLGNRKKAVKYWKRAYEMKKDSAIGKKIRKFK